ncbi:MAG: divalent metal cation transporter [Patescibacteria group bacterium]|nr:divalent metal cation transporter [Patescibacteria group bacterium]
MSIPPIEKKIKEGVIKHGKDIADNSSEISKEAFKAGKEITQSVLKVGEASLKTGIAVGKGVYGVSKATVKTGLAVGKATVSAAYFPIKRRRSIFDFFWKSKRGIITGAADNDPSGIVTYTQTGALAGYNLLWLAPLAIPLLVVVEEMSARIGIITRKGINRVVIENFGIVWAWLATIIILICNTITIGADIAAMADIASILTGLPMVVYSIFFGLVFAFILYKKGYATVSRWLFLVTPVFLLYIVSAFLFDVPWGQVLRDTFLPTIASFNTDFALVAVGFLGTTITPFLVFWETTQEIEERKDERHLEREKMGVTTGMIFTQVITFFIVVAAAAAFAGQNHLIATARDAALALKPLGTLSFLFFSLGILGSGLIAVPVLASTTGYTFSETMNWERGLNKSFPKAKGFYLVIFLSIIVGVIISLSGYNPILMLLYSQVLNGVLMPILLVFLMIICNSRKIMGKHINKFWTNFFGVLAILVNVGFVVLMFINWFK